MTARLSVLFASTALTLALGLPALAAVQAPAGGAASCGGICAATIGEDGKFVPMIRVSDDDNGDREDDDCDDDDEDDDDEGGCKGAAARANPAPAGTVAPPANGLFGNGRPPVAVTN